MAYGFQYIPGERGRTDRTPVGPGHRAEPGRSAAPRAFPVAPSATAITDVIEAIYRDIEDLRCAVPGLASDTDAIPVLGRSNG